MLSFIFAVVGINSTFSQNDGLNVGGTLDGWNLYTGLYTPTKSTNADGDVEYQYDYSWTSVTEEQARTADRIVLSGDMGSVDPIIACSNFLVNPDNKIVIRIGKNTGYADGRNGSSAFAERMTYDFVVNENTTLFTYKYACVLHVPTSDNHTSYQMPAFSVSVTLTSPEGQKVTLPCETFDGNASFNNSLLRNPSTCKEAKVESGQAAEDYVYKPWTTVSYDLTPYIGYTVNVDVKVKDCLVTQGSGTKEYMIAGSHKAYGYFWAETRPLELSPKNCGNDDATITAPDGFVSYDWFRCDDNLALQASGNVALVPYNEIVDGARYCCQMTGSDAACTSIQIDTILNTIDLEANFETEDACDLALIFKDKSLLNRDTIKAYRWNFGDGYTSAAANPTHTYAAAGPYVVSLTITSGKGCTNTITKNVTVRALPILDIDGAQNVCQGDPVSLSVLSSQVGNEFFWINQKGDTVSHDITMTDIANISQTYQVSIIDQFSCQYSKDVYVGVSVAPTVFIKGDSSVCYNTPAKLWVWGDADKYVWSTTHVGDTLSFTPQQSSNYCVTGTYTSTGCKSTKCVNVAINPLPTITITGPEQICSGEQAILAAHGGKEYLWEETYFGDSLTVGPSLTTTYNVVGTDSNGCANKNSYKLIVYTKPAIVLHGNKEICEGEQLTMWLEGASSYLWDDGSTSSVVNKSPALNTTSYWVEGTTNGCTTRLDIPIIVYEAPSVYIEGKDEICAGESVSLIAQGGSSYEWSTGEVISFIDKTLLQSQTFYVSATTLNGCVGHASYTVNVHPLPEFYITGNTEVCENTLLTLSASCEDNNCKFQWDNGYLGDIYSTYIADTTLYEVLATDTVFGCSSLKYYKVNTLPYPVLSYEGNSKVCEGTSANISVSGASSYMWHDGSTDNRYVFVPTASTTCWVEGTTNGCTSKLTIPIQVVQSPYIWYEGKTTICVGDSLSLVAHGTVTYRWNSSSVSDTFLAFPNSSSNIVLEGISSDNCSSKLTIPYTVNPKPVVGIVGDESVCINSNVTLTATGENLIQYVWSTGETNSTITTPVQGESTFSVEVWNSNGCSNTVQHTVKTVVPPTVTYSGNTTVCLGDTVTLLAQGALNYTWDQNSNIISYGDKLLFVPNGNAYIKLTGTQNNCSNYADIYVYTNPVPNLGIQGETYVCKNSRFSLIATGADSYEWSTGDDSPSISYPLAVSSTYTVTGYSTNGCSAKKSIFVQVYPEINVTLEEVDKQGCPNTSTVVDINATGALYFTWKSEPYNLSVTGTSSNYIEAEITERTQIMVEGEDANGCYGYDTIYVESLEFDDIYFQISPQVVDKEEPTVGFSGFKPKNSTWYWNAGDGSEEEVGDNIFHTYSESDVVTEDSFRVGIRAIDENGCVYTGESYVYVWKDFWVPSAFSPNGDNLNDKFSFMGGEYIDDFKYWIYNRMGQIIYEGLSIDDVWDGTYNGEPCPWGIYGWVASYTSTYKGIDKSGEKKGYVSILR